MPHQPQRPTPRPLDVPMTPFAVAGTALWALVGLALLPFTDTLAADGHTWWLWTCVAGFVSGLVGTAFMIRHDRRRSPAGNGADGDRREDATRN